MRHEGRNSPKGVSITYALIAVFLLAVALVGCGKPRFDATSISNTPISGRITARDAARHEFRFAFSGQAWNEVNHVVVPQFSVDLLLPDPAVNTLVNPLGSANGTFHLSRSPGASDRPVAALPLVVMAPGYEPQVRVVDVGADCESLQCPGRKPIPFFLKPQGVPLALPGAVLDPRKASELASNRPALQLFNELVKSGKVDAATESRLRSARTTQVLTHTLVLLEPIASSHLESTVLFLLASVRPERLRGLAPHFQGTIASLAPTLASQNPELASALVSSHALLPYLLPLQERLSDPTGGALAHMAAALLRERDIDGSVLTLVSALQGQSRGPQGQMAMAAVVPLIQGLLSKRELSQSPFSPLLQKVLVDPALANLLAQRSRFENAADPGIELVTRYAAPLFQALTGKKAPELATLFNELVTREGLVGLQKFKVSDSKRERFAALYPYLETLIKGLNGNEARALAAALAPLLSQRNPARALAGMMLSWDPGHSENAQLASRLFPGMDRVLQEGIASKQLFAAQLLSGLVNGDFKDIRIEQDLKSTSAVMVSVQARDLLKLAQLANVRRILSIEKQ